MDKLINITKRVKLHIDTTRFIFPLSFCIDTVGNDNRPYTFSIWFLCCRLIFCIDEDSY